VDSTGDTAGDGLSTFADSSGSLLGSGDFNFSDYGIDKGGMLTPGQVDLAFKLNSPDWKQYLTSPLLSGLQKGLTEMALSQHLSALGQNSEFLDAEYGNQPAGVVVVSDDLGQVGTYTSPELVAEADREVFGPDPYGDAPEGSDEALAGESFESFGGEGAYVSTDPYSVDPDVNLDDSTFDTGSSDGGYGEGAGFGGAFGDDSGFDTGGDGFGGFDDDSDGFGGGDDGGGDGGGDGCFIASTLVTLSDGSTLPIDKIEVGCKVKSASGNRNNTVTFIERVDWNEDYVLYSPVKDIEPFATRNHPIMVDGDWMTIDPDYTDRNHPWLDAKQLNNAYRKADKGVVVYNLWVDGDHTYQVNGYGTESLIGDGGVVRNGLSHGVITMDDFVSIANGAKNSSFITNYGMHLGNRIMAKFSSSEWYTRWILDSVMGKRKDYVIRPLIYIFGVIGTAVQPKMWKQAVKQYIIKQNKNEVTHGIL
jgi:hypothetical protein